MTRKDYYLIAGALKKCKSLGQENLEYVADMIATDLAKANPAFKRSLFMREAGVEVPPRYTIVDEQNPRFGQTGDYLGGVTAYGSKPPLTMHVIEFDDGVAGEYLSHQIEKCND